MKEKLLLGGTGLSSIGILVYAVFSLQGSVDKLTEEMGLFRVGLAVVTDRDTTRKEQIKALQKKVETLEKITFKNH